MALKAWSGLYGRGGSRDLVRANAKLPTSDAAGLIASDALLYTPIAAAVAPTFTITQGDKSASDGTTTTMTWEADGTPGPVLKVQRLTSGSGTPLVTGTPVAIALSTSATPGAQAVTVPTDAQGVLVFSRNYQARTLSLGSSFAGTFSKAEDTGNEITSVQYAAVTATGSQTITPTWSGAITDGPLFVLVFVKNIDNSSIAAWVRASDALADDVTGSATARTVTTVVGDLVIALDSQYIAGGAAPANEAGWTSEATQGNNNEGGRVRSLVATGTTTTATGQTTSYSGISIVSLIGVGTTWTDVTTGTNYTGSSPLTYTTPTLAIGADDGSQWRAVATNTAGSVNSASMTLTVTGGGGTSWTISPTGSTSLSGSLLLRKGRSFPASGTIAMSGTVVLAQGNVIPVSGSVGLSGTSGMMFNISNTLVVTGNVVFSGSAALTSGAGAVSYTMSVSGLITLSGAALPAHGRVVLPTGSIVLSGGTLPQHTHLVYPSGSVSFAGTSSWTKGNIVGVSGVITFNGSSPMAFSGTVPPEPVSTRIPLTFAGN